MLGLYTAACRTEPVRYTVVWFVPQVDCCDMEECLLHMAVETEHEQIFDDLLAYSSQTAQPWSQEIPLLYPWPNEDPSNPLTWRVCRARCVYMHLGTCGTRGVCVRVARVLRPATGPELVV